MRPAGAERERRGGGPGQTHHRDTRTHSITSAAAASTVAVMVRPRARALGPELELPHAKFLRSYRQPLLVAPPRLEEGQRAKRAEW